MFLPYLKTLLKRKSKDKFCKDGKAPRAWKSSTSTEEFQQGWRSFTNVKKFEARGKFLPMWLQTAIVFKMIFKASSKMTLKLKKLYWFCIFKVSAIYYKKYSEICLKWSFKMVNVIVDLLMPSSFMLIPTSYILAYMRSW